MSLLLMLAGSCADDEQSPEDVARQKREILDVMKAGRSAPQRYDDVVETLQVAVRSAQEAQLGRGGVGPKPAPPALKKACEDVQAAADDASALPLPHPPRYDEAIDFPGVLGTLASPTSPASPLLALLGRWQQRLRRKCARRWGGLKRPGPSPPGLDAGAPSLVGLGVSFS